MFTYWLPPQLPMLFHSHVSGDWNDNKNSFNEEPGACSEHFHQKLPKDGCKFIPHTTFTDNPFPICFAWFLYAEIADLR